MTDKINELASVHLGKTSDGQVSAPYVAPTKIDKHLLVPVPRSYNREKYGIEEDNLPFVGFDVWNCYEFSHLDGSGYPVSGVLKLRYEANTKNIVESKSLKLYLNSFNLAQIPDDIDVTGIIEEDFKEICDIDVKAHAHNSRSISPEDLFDDVNLFESLDARQQSIAPAFNESPDILQWLDGEHELKNYQYHSANLRSNCRITNQPDWGDIYISYYSDRVIDPDSLYRYIVSMRKENHFHEEICEMVYSRLSAMLGSKTDLFVGCFYTRRGGIDINPMRASSKAYLNWFVENYGDVSILSKRTQKQ